MRTTFGAIVLVMSLILGSAADAATVTVKVTAGELFISNGNGYERVPGTAQGRVGDSVMAGEFGVGQITYANGCVVTVRPGSVVTIEARSSCKAADDWSTNVGPASEGLSTHHILLGAAVVGGIGVGIYFLTKSDDNPMSP